MSRYTIETAVEFLPEIPAFGDSMMDAIAEGNIANAEFLPEVPWLAEPAPVVLPARFTASRKALVNRLKTVAAFSPKRSPKPILTTVRLSINGSVELTATNQESEITTRDDFDRSGDLRGLIHPAHLLALLKTVKTPEVELELTADNLTVRGGSATLSLPVEKFTIRDKIVKADGSSELGEERPQDLPAVRTGAPDISITVYSADLLAALQQTLYATDSESSRYALGGVLFSMNGTDSGEHATTPLTLAATDTRRLSVANVGDCLINSGSVNAKATYVIPVAFLAALRTFIESTEMVEIRLCEGRDEPTGEIDPAHPGAVITRRVPPFCEVIGDTWRAASMLIEGRFPAYRDILPTSFNREIVFKREEFLAALQVAQLATSEECRGVDFDFGMAEGEMQISITGKSPCDSGYRKSVATCNAASVWQTGANVGAHADRVYHAATFDPHYMAEYLLNLPKSAEYVSIEFTDSECAAVMRAANVNGLYVIMPLSRDR